MNIIKSIIVAALVLAFASPEAQGDRTIEKDRMNVFSKVFGDKRGVIILIHKDRYGQDVSSLKELRDKSVKERKIDLDLTPFDEVIKFYFQEDLRNNAEAACFRAYGLKGSKLEFIITGGHPNYDHDVAEFLFICKEDGEE